MNRMAGIMAVLAAAILIGCQKEQDVLSRLIVQPPTAAELGYGIQWQNNLGLGRDDRILHAQVFGDRLVTIESGNIVAVTNVNNGQVLWRQAIGWRTEQFNPPMRKDDSLVLSSSRRVHVYDIHVGEPLRVMELKNVTNVAPALTEDRLIHGTPDGVVFATELKHGLELWSYATGSALTTSPVIADSVVVVGNYKGHVLAFDRATGSLLWREATHGRITADIVASNRYVFVASEDQSLYAYFRQSGRLAWRYFTGDPLTRSPFLVPGGPLLQPVVDQGLVALNPESGEVLWKRPELYNAVPLMLQDQLIWAHYGETLVMLDAQTGETVQQVPVSGVQKIVAASVEGGDLYMIRYDGRIMKLSPR